MKRKREESAGGNHDADGIRTLLDSSNVINDSSHKINDRKYECVHGKYKYKCKECDASLRCEFHGKYKSICRECVEMKKNNDVAILKPFAAPVEKRKKTLLCDHGNPRSGKGRCKECKKAYKCPHGRRKNDCRECGGSSFCKHDLRRSVCKVNLLDLSY